MEVKILISLTAANPNIISNTINQNVINPINKSKLVVMIIPRIIRICKRAK